MAPSTKNSGSVGPRKPIEVKSRARVAVSSSPRKARGVRSPAAAKSVVAGISDTTTSTGLDTPDQSIPAAIEQPQLTKLLGEDSASDQASLSGGVPSDLSVTNAVKRDLAEMAKRAPQIASSGLAMTAVILGRQLDDDKSATSKSMCAKALVDVMDRLGELCPPVQKADRLDDLASRRKTRLEGRAAPAS